MYLKIRKTALHITTGQPFMFDAWTENNGRDLFIRFLNIGIVVSRTS